MVIRIKDRQNRIMFLNEALTDLYLALPRGPLAEACGSSGVAYTHGLKMINYWASLGLILKNKSGQQYNFFYTAKGNRLSVELLKLKTLLKKNDIQWCSLEEDDNGQYAS